MNPSEDRQSQLPRQSLLGSGVEGEILQAYSTAIALTGLVAATNTSRSKTFPLHAREICLPALSMNGPEEYSCTTSLIVEKLARAVAGGLTSVGFKGDGERDFTLDPHSASEPTCLQRREQLIAAAISPCTTTAVFPTSPLARNTLPPLPPNIVLDHIGHGESVYFTGEQLLQSMRAKGESDRGKARVLWDKLVDAHQTPTLKNFFDVAQALHEAGDWALHVELFAANKIGIRFIAAVEMLSSMYPQYRWETPDALRQLQGLAILRSLGLVDSKDVVADEVSGLLRQMQTRVTGLSSPVNVRAQVSLMGSFLEIIE